MHLKKFNVLGFDVDIINFHDALKLTLQRLQENNNTHIVTINPEIIQAGSKDEELKTILKSADLTIADGVGVMLALKLSGVKDASRIPGVDFAFNLLKEAAKLNYPVALVGSKDEIINKACENLKLKIPDLNITYCHNGFFDKNEESIIQQEIIRTSPKIVLVAMGGKKQEMFIKDLKDKIEGCVFIGVGGSFDVWSGYVKRAPVVFQKLGLEWLYRVISQPSRFKRIFPTLPMFLIKVIISNMLKESGGSN